MTGVDADALVRSFEPCFVRVLEIIDARAKEPVEPDIAAVRTSLLELIGEPANAPPAARRFVAAWADERLASDAWPGRGAWRAHPLQSDWGEGRAAGEWFFDAVARLNPAKAEDAALAALALRCLALGFDGRMHCTPREIADLRRALVLRFGFARSPAPFPPAAETGAAGAGGTAGRPRGGAGAVRKWLVPLAAAALLAGAYALAARSLDLHLNGIL